MPDSTPQRRYSHNGPVFLDLDAHVKGDHLWVSYRVENRGTGPVLIMDRMGAEADHAPLVEVPFDRNWADVEIAPSESETAILRRAIPVFESWSHPVLPMGRRLEPGEVVVEELEVPLPLSQNQPEWPRSDTWRDVDVLKVEFQLGYFTDFPFEEIAEWERTSSRKKRHTIDGEIVWHFPLGSWPTADSQQIIARSASRSVKFRVRAFGPPKERGGCSAD